MVPHLICFGDSLTSGYQSPGFGDDTGEDTPYGGFLQSWLGPRGKVTVSGICGEVTREMTDRFHRDVLHHRPEAVVILGGTNDLGCGLTPGSIMANLRILYRQGQEAGIQVVGVTVPSFYGSDEALVRPNERSDLDGGQIPPWIQAHIDSRRTLNRMIQATCTTMRMSCVDLFGGTSEEPHGNLAPGYSNDGLHLSTLGYERFAELVWQVLFEKRFGIPSRQKPDG